MATRVGPKSKFSAPPWSAAKRPSAHDSFSTASTGQMSIDLRPSHLINTERENRVQPATTPRRVAHSTPLVLAVAEHTARAAFVVSLTVSPFFKAILIRTKSFRGGWDRLCHSACSDLCVCRAELLIVDKASGYNFCALKPVKRLTNPHCLKRSRKCG
jgi:hypothetical protein